MLNRVGILLAGVALAASATGCCCLGGGMNRCNPCGAGYSSGFAAPSPCGAGGCAPSYGGGFPTGYIPNEGSQAFAPASSMAAAPLTGPAYLTTAFAPNQSLPTY